MTGDVQDTNWPLPKFFFQVEMCGQTIGFQEVSGLESETQVIEYRAGNSKQFSTVKMPGIAKTGNVTLKKGVIVNDTLFWDWYSKIKMNAIARETVTIRLLDGAGKATMAWTLFNAFPTKITGTDLKAEGNEVAVESIEIAHEGFVIENA